MLKPRVIRHIVAQHADEATFLWTVRTAAAAGWHMRLREIARFDARVEAHIDGLRIAGDAGLLVAQQQMESGNAAALFVAAVLAIEQKQTELLRRVVAVAESVSDLEPGLHSAFGWVAPRHLEGTVKSLLTSNTPFLRRLGISCCAMHGVDGGHSMQVGAQDPDVLLRSTALRSIGRLGRVDLLHECLASMAETDPVITASAASSAILLGARGKPVQVLADETFSPRSGQNADFVLALQAMSVVQAHSTLQQLSGHDDNRCALIAASGVAGDPAYIPWLIGRMHTVATARLAGEAFSLITAVDLRTSHLEQEPPHNVQSGPNDDPNDPNVDMDPDEGLPWPDVNKVEAWWQANETRFQKGTRYFMGQPVTREHCVQVLKDGYQPQRILAAQYLCLLDPGTPLFNTSAPAWRQQRLLAAM